MTSEKRPFTALRYSQPSAVSMNVMSVTRLVFGSRVRKSRAKWLSMPALFPGGLLQNFTYGSGRARIAGLATGSGRMVSHGHPLCWTPAPGLAGFMTDPPATAQATAGVSYDRSFGQGYSLAGDFLR